MASSRKAHPRLKTNLRLTINRLRLLGKKKAELAQKARKEVADLISQGKYERARVRVEHVIKEDYLVEALELVETLCDRLLCMLGQVLELKEMEPAIAGAVSTLLWAAPKLAGEVPELRIVSELLAAKFGRRYSEACRSCATGTISEELKQKLSLDPPPKVLIEKYLIEISRIYKVPYEPDPEVMLDDKIPSVKDLLIDMSLANDITTRPIGFVCEPSTSTNMFKPFNYAKTLSTPSVIDSHGQQSVSQGTVHHKSTSTNDLNAQSNFPPTSSKLTDLSFLNLPSVPNDNPGPYSTEEDDGEEDFKDIAIRFQELKRK